MKRRVVVTGLGAVTPIGNTVEEFWEGIKEGKVGIGEITKFDTTEYKVKIAAEVKDFQAKDRMDFKAARRMEPFAQYAVAAEDPADAADLENAIVLKATDGRTYVIDKDAQVTPYLTRNIVKLQDLTAGTSCLLWEDENGIVTKVMIFA